MCLIIHNPTGKQVSPSIISNAFEKNPDGFGITYLDTGETVKTLKEGRAKELLKTDRPFVCHFRYATRGKISKANCHPFEFSGNQLYSNGTVPLGCDKKTDTEAVAEILDRTPEKYWSDLLSLTDTRFLVVKDTLEVIKYGLWHEKDDCFFSKSDCFAQRVTETLLDWSYDSWSAWDDLDEFSEHEEMIGDYVAVYGTLKRGRGNHSTLNNAVKIGDGKTSNKYLMVDAGIPYVYSQKIAGCLGENIVVEIYRPKDAKTWENLDQLEGHPSFYERRIVDIKMNERTLKAWLYFAKHEPNPEDTFIAEF
jgi:gamma-glutamylaminecyclotransferase